MRPFILFMLMAFVLPFSLSAGNIEKAVTPNMEDKSPMSHFCWGADLGSTSELTLVTRMITCVCLGSEPV